MKRGTFLIVFFGAVAISILSAACQSHMKENLEPRTISIEVTVPDPAWEVRIQEVYVSKDRLMVVSSLSRDPEVMAPQVISTAKDNVTLPAPGLPVEHYVLGKTFGWAEEQHHFVRDRDELEEKLKGARLLYRHGD